MERETIKKLFGKNFIGREELTPFFKALGFENFEVNENSIEFDVTRLEAAAANGYILIYGVEDINGHKITLNLLREKFGVNPDVYEPCLYNQDWYLKEDFMNASLKAQWYLIKKEIIDESRAMMPCDLTSMGYVFPPAILCGYTFFAYYFARNEYLWWHDFVWCCDTDHNGDRIYVGKYHDIDGVNKNGFSIHRHLALRPCYGSVDYYSGISEE